MSSDKTKASILGKCFTLKPISGSHYCMRGIMNFGETKVSIFGNCFTLKPISDSHYCRLFSNNSIECQCTHCVKKV